MKIDTVIAALACLALTACAGTMVKPTVSTSSSSVTSSQPTASEPASLQARAIADLTQAAEDAKAATDPMAPVRLVCWNFLLTNMPQFPQVGVTHAKPSAGVFDTFERGAEVAEQIDTLVEYQVPSQLRVGFVVACGPIQARFNDLLIRWNLKAVSAAGNVGLLIK